MSRILKPEPLTRADFAPFGDVIEIAGATPIPIDYGATMRYDDLATLDCTAEGGSTSLSLFRSTPAAFPLTLKAMENHPLGTQSFMPLSGRPYLVVVAPRGWFDPAAVHAFVAGPDQGVNFARGTWHHSNLALGGPNDFLVIDRAPSYNEPAGNNCTEVSLAEFGLVLEAPHGA